MVANFQIRAAFVLAMCAGAFGQLPDAAPHKFLDKKNVVRISVLAGLVATDGITTQILMSKGAHEWDPVARPFVTNEAGQTAGCGIGLGASLGAAYLFHKTRHHKLETLLLHVSIGLEGATVTSNVLEMVNGHAK